MNWHFLSFFTRRSFLAIFLAFSCLLVLTAAQDKTKKKPTLKKTETSAKKKESATKKKKAIAKADITDCNIPFEGSERKGVKMRKPGQKYTLHNGGRAVTVSEFYSYVSGLVDGVPSQRKLVPDDEPLKAEKLTMKVKGYLMAGKSEDDNDFHLQISEKPEWKELTQLVVEIPPGEEYCEARNNYIKLVEAQPKGTARKCIFTNPPLVEVTGYLFLDASHMRKQRTDYATDNGGRGVRGGGMKTSPVRGIWELHPVTKLELVKK